MKFGIDHYAISVADADKSIAFYGLFGYNKIIDYVAEDNSVRIVHMIKNGMIIEFFEYKQHNVLPEFVNDLGTDLKTIGAKHLGLSVENLEEAARYLIEKNVLESMPVINHGRLGRDYFFVKDPDGIFVEIIQARAEEKLKFYGADNAYVNAVSDEYKGIKTPVDLYYALSDIWCEYTCAPRMRQDWTKENMTLGQCSITAFLVQDIFGGQVYGILRAGGNYHCYNVIGDCVFDLTSEQFGNELLDYSDNPVQSREVHFSKEEKKERYEYLKAQLKKYCEQ